MNSFKNLVSVLVLVRLCVIITIPFLGLMGCEQEQTSTHLTPVTRVDRPIEVLQEDETLKRFEDPKTHLWGYKDQQGKIIIPARFRMTDRFTIHGWGDFWVGGTTWLKINKQGKTLVQSYFFDSGPDYFASGLSRYVDNDKIGFIDTQANIVITAKYDFATPFEYSAPITKVCMGCSWHDHPCYKEGKGGCNHKILKGGKWGVIDSTGKLIVPIEYDNEGTAFNKPLVLTKDNKQYALYQNDQGGYVLQEYSNLP